MSKITKKTTKATVAAFEATQKPAVEAKKAVAPTPLADVEKAAALEAAHEAVKSAALALLATSTKTETRKIALALALIELYTAQGRTTVIEHEAMTMLCEMAGVSQNRRAARKPGALPAAPETFRYSASNAIRYARLVLEAPNRQCTIFRNDAGAVVAMMPGNVAEPRIRCGEEWVDNTNARAVVCRAADLDRVYRDTFQGHRRTAKAANTSARDLGLQALRQVSRSMLLQAFFEVVANSRDELGDKVVLTPTPKGAFSEADIERLVRLRDWLCMILPLDRADVLQGQLAEMTALWKQRDADYEAEYTLRTALEAKLAATSK